MEVHWPESRFLSRGPLTAASACRSSNPSHHTSTAAEELNYRRATMGYAQLVIGPAGSGKSTYCSTLYEHCETVRRTMHVMNLDPAAERFDYPAAMDIRELISLDDAMEELGLGPYGGLIYCMKHLEGNLDDWLPEELDNYADDDYLVFDCPGQIELFSHVPVLKDFVEHLKRKNFNVCAVYLLDSQFITDVTKFIRGCMTSLSAMVQLEVPFVNILSKMDLVENKKDLENYLNPEPLFLLGELNQRMALKFEKLNTALMDLVDEYSMIGYCIQYGEDADVKVKDFDEPDGGSLQQKCMSSSQFSSTKVHELISVSLGGTQDAH
ncbi:GPN-loop GTPase 3-like protein [Drosera capensis]